MRTLQLEVRLNGQNAGEASVTQGEEGDCNYEWKRPDGVIEQASFADLSQCSLYFAYRIRSWFARMH